MITLPVIIAMALASPVLAETSNSIIDPVIQAVPTTDMVVASTALPPTEVVATEVVATEALAEVAIVETPTGTLIDWGADGSTAVSSASEAPQRQGRDVGLVMLPLAAALFAGAWFFRKKVFSAATSNKGEDPINIVSRKTIAGHASVVLVDVTAADGTTRRLLLGSGEKGVNLVADISPMDSIFPDASDMFETQVEPQVAPEPVKNTMPAQHTPATVARFSTRLMDDIQTESMESKTDFTPEMPRFRKRNSAVPPLLAADIGTTSALEKRKAAQAVLDEVLAERKNDQSRGSRIRVTA